MEDNGQFLLVCWPHKEFDVICILSETDGVILGAHSQLRGSFGSGSQEAVTGAVPIALHVVWPLWRWRSLRAWMWLAQSHPNGQSWWSKAAVWCIPASLKCSQSRPSLSLFQILLSLLHSTDVSPPLRSLSGPVLNIPEGFQCSPNRSALKGDVSLPTCPSPRIYL